MNKKILLLMIILIFIIIILVIFVLLNKNNVIENEENNIINDINYNYEEYKYNENKIYPKNLENISELPLPSKIIYYKEGITYSFNFGSTEYNEIIKLNNNRNSKELEIYKMLFHNDIHELKQSIELLEYDYEKYGSVYFNLTGSYKYGESQNFSVKDTYWVYPCYDSNIFNILDYVGLDSPYELLAYLKSII